MKIIKQLRHITKNDAITSYKKLQELSCLENPGFNNAGIKALDYLFLKHRIKTQTKSGLSFYQAMNNAAISRKLLHYVKRWKTKTIGKRNMVQLKYDVFQLIYGSVNQFRPSIAKWLYCKLGAKRGILDISAGWGGRCLAAMSLGIPYIGIDANTNLKKSYTKMIELYGSDDVRKKIKMIFAPSETVDFSKFKYDLIFTSPPYFTLEEYENMPNYGSKQGFLDKFFIPVILSAWKNKKYTRKNKK